MSSSRKTNRDHAKKTQRPMVEDEVIAQQLEALVTPAITAPENYYRQLGLRERILNLPLMVAAVLTLLWRDVAGVTELTRMLAREGILWCRPKNVSQQAIFQRFLTFPAQLFEKVFKDLLPNLRVAWYSRSQRPLPESVQFTMSKFSRIWIIDSSTLEALFCKLKSSEDVPKGQLAGKMATVIDLITRLPKEEDDPIEQEKRLKYLGLVASALILHNTVDMSLAIQTLTAQGEVIHQRHIAALSPYVNRHIKRYGDYVVNLRNIPQPLEVAIPLPPEIFES